MSWWKKVWSQPQAAPERVELPTIDSLIAKLVVERTAERRQAIAAELDRLDSQWRDSLQAAVAVANLSAIVLRQEPINSDRDACYAECEALAMIGGSTAVGILRQAADPSWAYTTWRLRMAATQALGRLRDPELIPVLAERLQDTEGGVRFSAAKALGDLGEPALPVLLNAAQKDSWPLYGLARIPHPQALHTILSTLRNARHMWRNEAAAALREECGPRSIELLEELLAEEKSPNVRACCLEALDRMAKEYPDPDRTSALQAMARLSGRHPTPDP